MEEVVLRSAGVGRADDGPRVPVPALDQGLRSEVVGVVVADGPALRRRHARHAIEVVVLRSAGVGRGDDGPRGPVPALDQGLIGAAVVVVADGPALRCRHARHGKEVVVLRGAGVGRGDDGPRGPVPALDQGLNRQDAVVVVADGPALRGRHARHATEVVVLAPGLGELTMAHEVPSQRSIRV